MSARAENRILIVESDPGNLRKLRSLLTESRLIRFQLNTAARLSDALTQIDTQAFDLIITALTLPDSTGLDILQELRFSAPDVPVIVIAGSQDETLALEAVASGARDYLLRDGLDSRTLLRAMRHAIERNRAEDEQRQLVAIIEATTDVVWTASPTGQLRYLNAAGRETLGLAGPTDIGSLRVQDLHTAWAASRFELDAFPTACRDGVWIGESALRSTDGTEIAVSEIVIAHRSPSGRLVYLSTIARDIRDRKQIEERLAHLAQYDPLTGLPNRDLFRDRLQQAMQRANRNGRLLALLFLDLDNFKSVNDTLGHTAGDELLRQVAHRMTTTLRANDTVARLGGDEFTVIVENIVEMEDLHTILDKLNQSIAGAFDLGGSEVFVTASVGATLYPIGDETEESLLKHADAAMYQAKAKGRNTHQFYSPEVQIKLEQRVSLAADLRRALDRSEFFLEYQPEVDVRTGSARCVEALLRWRHPRRGLVMPGEFIPILEETGLINAIGEWVLRTACVQCQRWRDRGAPSARVAVNLSARQFRVGSLLKTVSAALGASSLDASGLELEITEGLMMENLHNGDATLRTLKSLGVTISIDDFGTGYSSLAYLQALPLDRLKIDRTFVGPLPDNAGASAITRSIIALAHNLGLAVVAEGVETEDQWRFLARHGCDTTQGYLHARPMGPDDVEPLLVRPFPLPSDPQ
ncbi:MAG: EAL domain-containing protein [Burkholderiales bacterium]|nr:EAL domain-containing protein [Burkholderiales bacterium]